MKTLLLVASVFLAGCSKKSEDAPAEPSPPTGPSEPQPLAKGAGPIADLQAEFSTDKSLAGKSIRLAGVMLNYGTVVDDVTKTDVTYVVVADRKTQMKPNIDCRVTVTKEAIDAMNLQQFDRVIIEGTVAESAQKRAELRNCVVSKEP